MDSSNHLSHYQLLQLSFHASFVEVRQAYLRLIRLHHPDKSLLTNYDPIGNSNQENSPSSDLAQQLIEAYSVLADPARRKTYDQQLQEAQLKKSHSSDSKLDKIVSQTLDLSEFAQLSSSDGHQEDLVERFVFPCRCGGQFMITGAQMDSNIDIIGCDGCSLTVKVEFECSSG